MTQGPGPHYGETPPPGSWGAAGMAWPGQAGPGQPANPYGAYQQPGWSPGPQPFGYPGPPPGRDRKRLVIGLSLGAVLLVVIGVISFALFRGGAGDKSAGGAVKGYLEALAKGDAAKALTYSRDKPADMKFLNNETLQQQIAKWPITDIRILSDAGGYGYGRVHVSAKFGDKISDEEILVKKSGKKWMLEHAAVKLDLKTAALNNDALKTLTVFGQAAGESPVYVFPGWLDLGSKNPNLQATPKTPILLNELSLGSGYFGDVEFSLSANGEKAVRQAVNAKLVDCTSSTELSPANCPQRVYDYKLVDGSARWGTPDTRRLKIELRPFSMEATVSGDLVFPLTARTRSGDDWRGSATTSVYWRADVSKDPVKISGY